jgi:FeS assembly SUF system protein
MSQAMNSETLSEPQQDLFPNESIDVVAPLSEAELESLTQNLIAAFKSVYDPEIPVDIYELGLIYKVDVSDAREVAVEMTLTAPGCPVAGEMPGWVKDAVMGVKGVASCHVNLVFDPAWESSRMSDEAKLQLNMF